eukprot:scaffold73021_cov61-Phaeocystis_antarctica.AAC.7
MHRAACDCILTEQHTAALQAETAAALQTRDYRQSLQAEPTAYSRVAPELQGREGPKYVTLDEAVA